MIGIGFIVGFSVWGLGGRKLKRGWDLCHGGWGGVVGGVGFGVGKRLDCRFLGLNFRRLDLRVRGLLNLKYQKDLKFGYSIFVISRFDFGYKTFVFCVFLGNKINNFFLEYEYDYQL